jgi:hypothetical protein
MKERKKQRYHTPSQQSDSNTNRGEYQNVYR